METEVDAEVHLASGLNGTVHLDMTSETAFRTWTVTNAEGMVLEAGLIAGEVRHRRRNRTDVLWTTPPGDRDRSKDRLIANLFTVARGKAAPVCTGADGWGAIALAESIAAVASTGEPVSVPVWAGADR